MGYLSNLRRALVGQVEAKASAVGAMIARVNLGQPVWPKRDYEKLGREGYQQNPVVARSVDLIANGVASITMEMHRGRGKRAQVLDDHPLLSLLANPNPDQDGQGLIAALVSQFIISGNLYLERTGDQLERMELYALRPDRIRIVPGPDGWPEAYEYRVGGMIRRFPVDVARGTRPLLHLKRFHPTDDWYGMSALDPAAWGIDTHSAAAQFNKALLDNAATPSGAYVYKPTDKGGDDRLSDDQYHRLKQNLEEQMSGARNAGRPLLLEGGLDWKQLGLNLENLQFVDAKNQAAREIAFALGVPPMLLGIPGDNTYANYAEANRAFYRQTVIPLAQWLARALTHWFREQLGRDERLVVDLDSITALDVERQALWDKLERSSFLTVNEKREALGYQPVEGGDEVYVGAGQLPIGNPDAAAIAGGPAPAPEDEDPQQKPGSGSPPGDKRRLN